MGDWAIVIQGTGAHHNKEFPKDADRMSQRFVDELVEAGHEVRLATFTSGGRTVLDTVDNVASKHRVSLARQGPKVAGIEEQIEGYAAKRREALATLSLHLAPRKDPVVT
jgi:hypothetical protein